MLTKDFCDFLEYQLTTPLEKLEDINLPHCWCDGVLMPYNEKDYSTKTVNNTRKIITQAWIDEGMVKGKARTQCLYKLTIHFGRKSLKRYMNGKEFTDCIPGADDEGWLMFDFDNKEIEIQLL